MTPFRVYYHDGTVVETDKPEVLNTDKFVQAIAWDDPSRASGGIGRIVLREFDIYIYSDDIGWHGTDKYSDLINHLKKGCGPGGVRAVLEGRWINRELYLDIIKRAETDEGLARRSGRDPTREDGSV